MLRFIARATIRQLQERLGNWQSSIRRNSRSRNENSRYHKAMRAKMRALRCENGKRLMHRQSN